MPLLERLHDFLQAKQAVYTHSVHRTAYTAREVASGAGFRRLPIIKDWLAGTGRACKSSPPISRSRRK